MKSALIRTGVVTGCLVLALSGWGRSPPSAPAPAPLPPPPPTALAPDIVQMAANYQSYVRQASQLTSAFTDGTQIQSEMQAGEAYTPVELSHGAIAYAAVIALQDPTFVASVKEHAKNPAGRAQMIKLIYGNPAYAGQFDGAQSAASMIVAKLTADGEAVHQAGSAIKQAAYTVQHEKWSKDVVSDRDGRLATAKLISGKPMASGSDDSAQLMQAATSGTGMNISTPPSAVQPPYTEGVMRGLAIAALAVLGAAGENNDLQLASLLDEQNGPTCLNLAKLNQYQCLAVSRPHYEDMFCLGQHVLMDTGRCVQKIVGTAPAEVLEVNPAAFDAAQSRKASHTVKPSSRHHRHGHA
jgi:hypothetical protein